jgi:hypothetical protein
VSWIICWTKPRGKPDIPGRFRTNTNTTLSGRTGRQYSAPKRCRAANCWPKWIGFSHAGGLIWRISFRVPCKTSGRPGSPLRTFQVQNSRKPLRCRPITVSGFTMARADRQPVRNRGSPAQRKRSTAVSFGRFTERCRIPSWWRRAKISSCGAARERNKAKTDVKSAVKTRAGENRPREVNSQSINQIGISGNHSLQRVRLWEPGFCCELRSRHPDRVNSKPINLHDPFRGRQHPREAIVLCVCWYPAVRYREDVGARRITP